MADEDFEPRIVAYVCNWCAYAAADLAGTSRLEYASNVRVVKVPCMGRIDPMLILKAFEGGAEGVLMSGCHPGDCHYNAGNYVARRRWIAFSSLLDFVGIDRRRVHFRWISAAEGAKWADTVNEVTKAVRELGPFTTYPSIPAELARTRGR
jgi:F420-non-reducing hydrogenase iron-sulfur subunit